MIDENGDLPDPVLALTESDPPWRRKPDAPDYYRMPWQLRVGLLMLVTGGHLLTFWVFDRSSFTYTRPLPAQTTTLVFLEPPPEPEPEPPPPEPEPVPVPEPVPEPEPQAEQLPEPEPEPEPEPPAPEPVPTPEPEPEPEPEAPVPEPSPEPEPEPEPQPEPIEVPEPVVVQMAVPEPSPERVTVPDRVAVETARPDVQLDAAPVEFDVQSQRPERVAVAMPEPTVAPPEPIRKKKPKLEPILGDVPEEEAAMADIASLPPPASAPASEFPPPPGGPAGRTMQAVDLPRGASTSAPLRLYNADGSLDLPPDVISDMAATTSSSGEDRKFSFQLKGLDDADRFMKRQRVMVYEPTRFDQYWQPDQAEIVKLLAEAVERTTGTIKIPIPGSPGSTLVCTVSILAAGGGCGISNNNDGYLVELNDPDTLNPEEDKQCQAWWDKIVNARTQAEWRGTRDLYEAQCRKPLEKDKAVPLPKG